MSNEPVAWLYTDAHEPRNRHLEWVENAKGYRGDWIKAPLFDTDDTALLRQAYLLCDEINKMPHVRGSINGMAVQLQYALRERLEGKA